MRRDRLREIPKQTNLSASDRKELIQIQGLIEQDARQCGEKYWHQNISQTEDTKSPFFPYNNKKI